MTIAFDFDGVIHSYHEGWKDGGIYGEINSEVVNLIANLTSNHNVIILSTRSPRQIKKYFDSFVESETIYHGGTEGMTFYRNLKIPFRYKVVPFWVRKFWNKKGVVGITNRKLVYDVLVDDRVILFDRWKISARELLFKILCFESHTHRPGYKEQFNGNKT